MESLNLTYMNDHHESVIYSLNGESLLAYLSIHSLIYLGFMLTY